MYASVVHICIPFLAHPLHNHLCLHSCLLCLLQTLHPLVHVHARHILMEWNSFGSRWHACATMLLPFVPVNLPSLHRLQRYSPQFYGVLALVISNQHRLFFCMKHRSFSFSFSSFCLSYTLSLPLTHTHKRTKVTLRRYAGLQPV